MKKLQYVEDNEQVTGKVIEHTSDGFVLKEYGMSEFGDYDELSSRNLEPHAEPDILLQDGLANQIRRLHYYFKDADYICEDVIFTLNIYDEDAFEVLKDIIDF